MNCRACNRTHDEPCCYVGGCPKLTRARQIAAEAAPRVKARRDREDTNNQYVRAALLAESNQAAARAVAGFCK